MQTIVLVLCAAKAYNCTIQKLRMNCINKKRTQSERSVFYVDGALEAPARCSVLHSQKRPGQKGSDHGC